MVVELCQLLQLWQPPDDDAARAGAMPADQLPPAASHCHAADLEQLLITINDRTCSWISDCLDVYTSVKIIALT